MTYKIIFYAIWVVATFGMFIKREASFTDFCLMQGIFAVGAAHIELLSMILAEIHEGFVTQGLEEDVTLDFSDGDDDDGK